MQVVREACRRVGASLWDLRKFVLGMCHGPPTQHMVCLAGSLISMGICGLMGLGCMLRILRVFPLEGLTKETP